MAGGENGIVKTLEDYKINIQAPSNELYEKMKSKSKIAVQKKISWQKIAEQLYISGVWLHGLQDRWAHGTEKEREKYKFKHNDLTDDFRYDHKWSKKNNYKKVKVRYKYKKRKNMKNKEAKNILKKNKRLWSTIRDTVKYITNIRKSLEKQDIAFFRQNKGNAVYKDIIKEEKNCLYSELFLN